MYQATISERSSLLGCFLRPLKAEAGPDTLKLRLASELRAFRVRDVNGTSSSKVARVSKTTGHLRIQQIYS